MTTIVRPDEPIRVSEEPSSHTFGVVYANDIAFADMMKKPPLEFRPGAIIVRAKLARENSEKPDLLAVMIKRNSGFNPTAHDWEFLVVNGEATKVRKRDYKGECLECHRSQHDFVYGDYVKKL